MSKTYLQIQIGEEKIGLKFNMGAFDVMTADDERTDKDKGTKDVAILIYAGMVGNSISKDEEPTITIEQVKKKLKKLDFDELVELGNLIGPVVNRAYNKKEPVSEEGNADTQPKQTLNVA